MTNDRSLPSGAPQFSRPVRGVRFYELISDVALPFANGNVPTMPVAGLAFEKLASGVRTIYPELDAVWELIKAGSSGYVTQAAILTHPTFEPSRTAIGLLSSRVGNAERRQEWLFASTGAHDPLVYATLPRGIAETSVLKHTNALASLIIDSGTTDFSPYVTPGGKPRLGDHWPEWTNFAEDDLRVFLAQQDRIARERPSSD